MTSQGATTKVLMGLINFLGQTPSRQKVCRFFQYFSKYLSSSYIEINESQPFMRNEMLGKIKKADALAGSMGMARKILRFGPSINCIKTFILNTIELVNGQNKESTPIFVLKTLSALWIAMFFICDHYLWLFKMGVTSNEVVRVKAEYLSILGWYLDCYTGLIKNLLIYLQLTDKEKREQSKALLIDSIRLLIDLPVAYSFMYPGTVRGKVAGVCGSISSAIGIYQLWK